MSYFSPGFIFAVAIYALLIFKGTVMQIAKALINYCLRVSKVS